MVWCQRLLGVSAICTHNGARTVCQLELKGGPKMAPFLRETAECFAHHSHRLMASVRLSVTLVICIKTMQARITKSSLWASARTLVYHTKFLARGCWGSLKRGRQRGVPPKKMLFCRYWLV